MKSSEIKELSNTELSDKIQELSASLNKMKLNHVISPIENPMLIKKNRRDIARLKTEKRKRDLLG
jgi:large subunit ribosomal protein L29